MKSELKKKFDSLLMLQENEIETAAVQSKINEIPGKISALEATASESEKLVSEASARLSDLQQMFRSHESEAKSVQANIAKSEDKLRSVKTNKEYQSSLKEIEDLAATISTIEDQMISYLEEIDEMETIISEKKVERKRIIQDIDQQMERLRQEEKALRQKIADLGTAQGDIVKITDPELLKLYKIVKKNIGSFAIAKVKEAVCMGCHVNIPPQMFNELLRFDKVFYCPHCERLIYPITSDVDDHKDNL